MKIKIAQHFVIYVPILTDYLKDLRHLHEINFGMFNFNNEDYEALNKRIVLSKNTNWNKAIALVVLNEPLIAQSVFVKKPKQDYPYYSYPNISLRNKISYIIESLAVNSLDSLIKNVKQNQSYLVATYIVNAMTYSFSLDKDYLIGKKTQLEHMENSKKKQKISINWIDARVRYNRLFGRPKSYVNALTQVREKINNNDQLLNKINQKIDFYKSKITLLDTFPKNENAQGSTKSLLTIYRILIKKKVDEAKQVLVDCQPGDFIKLENEVNKQLTKLYKEKQELQNLALLKEQEKQLVRIFDYDAIKSSSPHYVLMEKLDLLSFKELAQKIDQNSSYCDNPLRSEIYQNFHDEMESMLLTLSDRGENLLRLRYGIVGSEH